MPISIKPLRHPKFWLGLWIFAIDIVIILSLIPPPPLLMELPKHTDKAEHFIAYFLLAASAVQLFKPGRFLGLVGGLLILLGIVLEWAQGALTTTRMADPFDALANALGVLCGLAIVFTPLRDVLLKWQPRQQ